MKTLLIGFGLGVGFTVALEIFCLIHWGKGPVKSIWPKDWTGN
jgi:hypothetical protein